MRYIGIDPGLDGAVAVLSSSGQVLECWDTPTLTVKHGKKNKREYQVSVMRKYIRTALRVACETSAVPVIEVSVVLEQVHAMPGQGVTSMFSMGMGYGLWQGLVAAYKLPLVLVPPQRWKKHFSLGKDKQASIIRAQRLLPSSFQYLTLKKHDGRAEAMLMAEWFRQTRGL